MCETRAEWQACLDAAERKIKIAAYHLEHLNQVLVSSKDVGDNLPSIAVQAHFEGVVVSVIAAIDQVVYVAKSAFGLPLSQVDIPEVKIWYENKLGVDLRCIRVRMVHYSYKKKPLNIVWVVEPVEQSKYAGSRELAPYASAALEYGIALCALFPQIKQLVLESVSMPLVSEKPVNQ